MTKQSFFKNKSELDQSCNLQNLAIYLKTSTKRCHRTIWKWILYTRSRSMQILRSTDNSRKTNSAHFYPSANMLCILFSSITAAIVKFDGGKITNTNSNGKEILDAQRTTEWIHIINTQIIYYKRWYYMWRNNRTLQNFGFDFHLVFFPRGTKILGML